MTVTCVIARIAPKQKDNPSKKPSKKPDPGPPSWIEDVIPSRVQQHVLDKHDEVLPEQAMAEEHLPENDDSKHVEHVVSIRRFADAGTSEAVAAYADNVVPDAEWAVVIPHICDCDEPAAERTGCSHDETEQHVVGSPPSEVLP